MIRCLATGHEVIARLMKDASISPPDAQQMEWLQFLGFVPPLHRRKPPIHLNPEADLNGTTRLIE